METSAEIVFVAGVVPDRGAENAATESFCRT
jgi:hypothetical protein